MCPRAPTACLSYDEKGEVVARCDRKDDTFGNCKIEPGFSLDDLMNAWVHAYKEMRRSQIETSGAGELSVSAHVRA